MTNARYRPDPQFAALAGPPFADPAKPADFPRADLRFRNDRIAASVGLETLTDEQWRAHFWRFQPLPGNLSGPLALRYHGHQFRTYNPELGDGRGFLYAQVRDGDDRLLDLATKGSGKTPYSRTADGRLTLKGGIRELLATEMLEGLGVYTSKTFSIIETGERLVRGDEPSPTRSCVLVRLGHSHVRFGSFQRLAHEGDRAAIERLVRYCIAQFEPDLERAPAPVEAWFERVVARTARLVAQWMAAGFVHGVLNTDNMNVTGESFDYGPWRFLPVADFSFTAAYFDQTGLYAYGRQPDAGLWNLSRLGGALALVADEARLNAGLQTYSARFEAAMVEAFHARLGVAPAGEADFDFVVSVLKWMEAAQIPFERMFFDWFAGSASSTRAEASAYRRLYDDDGFAPVRAALEMRAPVGAEQLEAEYFKAAAPCAMLIEDVEAVWAPIAAHDDWTLLKDKLEEIGRMRAAHAFPASRYWRP